MIVPIVDNVIGFVRDIFGATFVNKTDKLKADVLLKEYDARVEALKASGEIQKIIAARQEKIAALTGHYQTTANEAASSDKWTSRARPSVVYYVVLYALLAFPFGILYVYYPLTCDRIIKGMELWFNAIPKFIEYFFLGMAGIYFPLRSIIDKRAIKK
jgi:hypothetical protein